MNEIKFIAFGGGQCSSILPFILDDKDYDLIIFSDTSIIMWVLVDKFN